MVRYLGPGSLIWVIPDYTSALREGPVWSTDRPQDNYIAHTQIGDPVMDAVAE